MSTQKTVRVTIPASVAFKLSEFENGIDKLVERLGCGSCFSGVNCHFLMERDFVINEKLEVLSKNQLRLQNPGPDGEPAIAPEPVNVVLPPSVSTDLKTLKSVLPKILGQLGCSQCSSGFDLHFLTEIRTILVDQRLNSQKLGNF